jgi:hypothetical protein
MPDTTAAELHKKLQEQFDPSHLARFTSTATSAKVATDVEELMLDEEKRGRLPLTRADLVIKEDPRRIAWEREVRKFLSKLNGDFGHKVTGAMVYEWATGVSLAELAKAEGVDPEVWRGGARWGSANAHLRHINAILLAYFGTPRKTTIAGRHVGKAYTVRPSFRVKDKKPATIVLQVEWSEGTLEV